DRLGGAARLLDNGHQIRERLIELLVEAVADQPAGRVPADLSGEKHGGSAGAVGHAVAVALRIGQRRGIDVAGVQTRFDCFCHRTYAITSPPSTPYACPVMADASGSARNRTT